MAGQAERRDPHATVKRELLVRYLDAWTAAVTRSHRNATYIESALGGPAADALRVFGEFADRLSGHQLDVVLLGAPAETLAPVLRELGEPPGVAVHSVSEPDSLVVEGPALAHLDVVGESVLDEEATWRLADELARAKAREVLLTVPPATAGKVDEHRARLRSAGLSYVVAVELVDNEDHGQLLMFATSARKHLATFKDELWAVDEFAGVRYRDPGDDEGALVDISLTPQLTPLRRMLLAELARRGSCGVADLQEHTLLRTIYRPAEALRVLQSAASAGAISRKPEKGRLTPRTVVASA
ncbi:hypothetical protein [Haloechinothrix salitolerans]|uniref:Three-Cys-motif partner protein n=1 Tax=Haloechinothrix salitolerans TaxID=926830 RepID=A0ABW2C227_9PSEU